MIIHCPSCKTKFKIDDERAKAPEGIKFRCFKCKEVFVVGQEEDFDLRLDDTVQLDIGDLGSESGKKEKKSDTKGQDWNEIVEGNSSHFDKSIEDIDEPELEQEDISEIDLEIENLELEVSGTPKESEKEVSATGESKEELFEERLQEEDVDDAYVADQLDLLDESLQKSHFDTDSGDTDFDQLDLLDEEEPVEKEIRGPSPTSEETSEEEENFESSEEDEIHVVGQRKLDMDTLFETEEEIEGIPEPETESIEPKSPAKEGSAEESLIFDEELTLEDESVPASGEKVESPGMEEESTGVEEDVEVDAGIFGEEGEEEEDEEGEDTIIIDSDEEGTIVVDGEGTEEKTAKVKEETEPAPDVLEQPVRKTPQEPSRVREKVAPVVSEKEAEPNENFSVRDSLTSEVSKPRKTRKSPLRFIVILLLLAILGGAGYYFYPTIQTMLPFGKGTDVVSDAGERSAPQAVEEGEIAITGLQNYFVQSEFAGLMFVIEGNAVNNFPTAKSRIKLEATLYDAAGNPITKKSFFCGNVLNETELKINSKQEIETALRDEESMLENNTNIPPGGSVPFMTIFYDPSEAVQEFGVKVVGYENAP